jgi:hypothetical protein
MEAVVVCQIMQRDIPKTLTAPFAAAKQFVPHADAVTGGTGGWRSILE